MNLFSCIWERFSWRSFLLFVFSLSIVGVLASYFYFSFESYVKVDVSKLDEEEETFEPLEIIDFDIIEVFEDDNIDKEEEYENLLDYRRSYYSKYYERFVSSDFSVESTGPCKLVPDSRFTLKQPIPKKFVCDHSHTFLIHDREKDELHVDRKVCEGVVSINWINDVSRNTGPLAPPARKWKQYKGDVIKMESNHAEAKCSKFTSKYPPKKGKAGTNNNFASSFVPPKEEVVEKLKTHIRMEDYNNSVYEHAPSILMMKFDCLTRAMLFKEWNLGVLTGELIKKHLLCTDEDYCTHRAVIYNRITNPKHQTAHNLVQLLAGEEYPPHLNKIRDSKKQLGYNPKEIIYDYAKKKFGHVLGFGQDIGYGLFATRERPFTADTRSAVFQGWLGDRWWLNVFTNRGNGVSTAVCLGNTFACEHELNFTLDYFRYEKLRDHPKFGIMTFNDLHAPNPIYGAKPNDGFYHRFLTEFMRDNPDTIIIFFGDHGRDYPHVHFDKYVHYTTSQVITYADHLPALIFLIPDKISRERPELERHLIDNSQRLTTWYDVHYTIKSLLNYPNIENVERINRSPLKKIYNLIEDNHREMDSRTCEDILFTKDCVCKMTPKKVTTEEFSEIHEGWAKKVIDEVNRRGFGMNEKSGLECLKVSLDKIDSVTEVADNAEVVISSQVGPSTWQGAFEDGRLVELKQITMYSRYEKCQKLQSGKDINMFCICEEEGLRR